MQSVVWSALCCAVLLVCSTIGLGSLPFLIACNERMAAILFCTAHCLPIGTVLMELVSCTCRQGLWHYRHIHMQDFDHATIIACPQTMHPRIHSDACQMGCYTWHGASQPGGSVRADREVLHGRLHAAPSSMAGSPILGHAIWSPWGHSVGACRHRRLACSGIAGLWRG